MASYLSQNRYERHGRLDLITVISQLIVYVRVIALQQL
jgi:hypothetical protein